MHISPSLSLAIIGAAANVVYGFSLNPRPSTYYPCHHPLLPTETKRVPKTTVSFLSPIRQRHEGGTSYVQDIVTLRGGGDGTSSSSLNTVANASNSGENGKTFLRSFVNAAASLWGAGGVIMILGKSIKRILPISMEPFASTAPAPLTTFQLCAYVATCLWFAYVEGYKGFQLKFSPLVVSRSLTLTPLNGTPIHHTIFGPFYAMGLFHASKKRKIVSWSVTIGVAIIVAAVKRLPYPWRNIVDAGVIVGLSWGSLSIAVEWVKAVIMKKPTTVDPALPN